MIVHIKGMKPSFKDGFSFFDKTCKMNLTFLFFVL